MARKASKKLIEASDNLVRRYTSHNSELDTTEYASFDDNYDLIIAELDYVNTQIANIHGNHPHKPAPKAPKAKKRKSATNSVQTEWRSAKDLMAYFPNLLQQEITTKLCELQPIMQDKIMKRGRLMALHISALPEFARRAGLAIIPTNGTTKRKPAKTTKKIKKAKKQHPDEDNMVYVI
ncbi:MAG: hypothetical protein K2M34_01775, partial [Alphaproteobacteria bacterium]|nr:hypothetical protein [Alphaproteobacteria bacterium]